MSYKIPAAGDRVLLRNPARDQHLGRKLDPKRTEPRLVDRLSRSGMSAYLHAIYEPPDKAKRYHIDDLGVYSFCNASASPAPTHASMVTYK